MRAYATTDVGHTRAHNEDTFLVGDLETGRTIAFGDGTETLSEGEHGLLFLVADGMGGAAAGELASAMAAEVVFAELVRRWQQVNPPLTEVFAEALRDATEEANARIHRFARENVEHRGMGTTATVAGLLGDRLFIAQVGDSRAYLCRDGRLILLTRDQSLMQRLVDAGEITEQEAEESDRRNIILQALGPEPMVRIDLTHQQVRLGDTLIVCSDGLSGVLRQGDITQIATEETDPAVLCHRLVARANELGGPDNITVIAARFEGHGLGAAVTNDEVGHTAYPLRGTLADEIESPAPSPSPTPYKSDPSPGFAARVGRDPTAGPPDRVPSAPLPVDDSDLADRRARVQPLMLLLVLLGLAAALWTLWRVFPLGD